MLAYELLAGPLYAFQQPLKWRLKSGLDGVHGELDSFFLFKWLVLEPVGLLEDPPLVASLLDTEGCVEEVECFLYPGLAPGFVPWGTLSALEEGLGALGRLDMSVLQTANICLVKRANHGLTMEREGESTYSSE
ncbi:hypothetical protein Tco_1029509 [Tanacetum coccineum]|uniref:Uncharacterized protein n=1 Tax=Tanacetum coccineum TaxID=301880 RepID=A0ABQ5G570_9ASTR